jgi:hypothetical protein
LLTVTERRILRWEGKDFACLAMSPDGKLLASGGAGAAVVWDATGLRGESPEKAHVSEHRFEALWTDLASTDTAHAGLAIWRLASTPAAARFLGKHLEAHKGFDDPKRIVRLVDDLDDNAFAVRRRAEAELDALAKLAEPALRVALAGKPSLEMQRRIEHILQRIDPKEPAPGWARILRSVEVLEHSGTAEAREVLAGLVKGAPEARLTREAQAALRRLEQRK